MKINNENINEIVLRHNSKNVKFHCYTGPSVYEMTDDNLSEGKCAEIVFDDSMEIAALIGMLESFLKELCGRIGFWE